MRLIQTFVLSFAAMIAVNAILRAIGVDAWGCGYWCGFAVSWIFDKRERTSARANSTEAA